MDDKKLTKIEYVLLSFKNFLFMWSRPLQGATPLDYLSTLGMTGKPFIGFWKAMMYNI